MDGQFSLRRAPSLGALLIAAGLLVAASSALAGCNFASMKDNSPEDVLGRHFLELVRTGDYVQARALVLTSERDKATDAFLDPLRALIDKPEPREVTLIGVNALINGSTSRVALTYQIHNPDHYVLAKVLVHVDGDPLIEGLYLEPVADDLRRINALNLGQKSAGHYEVLVFALGVLGFMVYVLVLCIRTPMRRNKWAWILFILFGVGKLWINWTSGAVSFQPLAVQLVLAGFEQASPYGPIMIWVSFPLGAIVFLSMRDRLVRQAKDEQAAKAAKANDGWPKMVVQHGPQVVGLACAVCGERIMFDSEATPCATCEKPVHLGCQPHAHDQG